MEKRQDANFVFSDLVEQTVSVYENLPHSLIAFFGHDPPPLTQSLEGCRQIERSMENPLCTDE